MATSKLKLNHDKTEFIHFGSNPQRDMLEACLPIDISGSPLSPPGVWFNSDFPCLNIFLVCFKYYFMQLSGLRCVGQFFTYDLSTLAANTLVSSRLDYCNSLFSLSVQSI